MGISRRDFIKVLGYSGLGLLLYNNILKTEENPTREETKLILPTLEEITEMFSKTPQEILGPAINDDLIKKFRYTRQTTIKEFYRFLNENFKENIVFVYINANKNSFENKGFRITPLSAGAAIVFYYSAKNLQNSDVACIFLEFTDFYGEQHWNRAKLTFQNRLEGLPSYAEFVRKNENYVFADITGTSLKDPEKILKYIYLYVDDFRKRTSK